MIFPSFARFAIFLILQTTSVVYASAIPNLPHPGFIEEGFLWKKSLVVTTETEDISFEETHSNFYNILHQFQLELKKNDEILENVKKVILDPGCSEEIKTIFIKLNHEGKFISEILDSSGLDYCEELFANPVVNSILRENLKRLQKRNTCMGNLEYFQDGKADLKAERSLNLDEKPIIFFSGLGNELIRIIEKTDFFSDYSYVIFHHGETTAKSISISHFQKSLEELYLNTLSLFPEDPLNIQMGKEATRLLSAEKRAKKNKAILCREAQELIKQAIEEYLDSDNPVESLEGLNINKMIPSIIDERKGVKQDLLALREKFYDSEQALRYYVFSLFKAPDFNLLYRPPMGKNDILVLNIHTEMDPCKWCTNALSLECRLRGAPKFISNGPKPVGFCSGFFQELYNHNKKIMPQVFILVSSQDIEPGGGYMRRETSGRSPTDSIDSSISLTSPIRLFFRHNGGIQDVS